jgi:hypothetical protein
MAAELLNVGDGFECLHGSSPFDGHKKARDVAGVMVDWMVASGDDVNGPYGFFI